MMEECQKKGRKLEEENTKLKTEVEELREEMKKLKGASSGSKDGYNQ